MRAYTCLMEIFFCFDNHLAYFDLVSFGKIGSLRTCISEIHMNEPKYLMYERTQTSII